MVIITAQIILSLLNTAYQCSTLIMASITNKKAKPMASKKKLNTQPTTTTRHPMNTIQAGISTVRLKICSCISSPAKTSSTATTGPNGMTVQSSKKFAINSVRIKVKKWANSHYPKSKEAITLSAPFV